jgi:hypothetical protein
MREKLEDSVQSVKSWAKQKIDRIVYEGTRPVSICATVDAATREAAIARGNAIAHSTEIAEIESASAYVIECLTGDRERS